VVLADQLLYLAKERGRARACGLVAARRLPETPEDELLDRLLEDPEEPGPGFEYVELVLSGVSS
jgi:hypothetical protein